MSTKKTLNLIDEATQLILDEGKVTEDILKLGRQLTIVLSLTETDPPTKEEETLIEAIRILVAFIEEKIQGEMDWWEDISE